jgi:secreted PhoX family phosphatase
MRRRDFIRRLAKAGTGAVVAPSVSGLAAWNFATPRQARSTVERRDEWLRAAGYGPLRPSADAPELQIPEEFRCVRISQALGPAAGRPDLRVPNAFDGMAAFPLPNGNIRLIRNHEMVGAAGSGPAIGRPAYDSRATGGTTSLEVRVRGSRADRSIEVVDEVVTLAGTRQNCAGGPTPWGSWLSCEENTAGPAEGFERPHGYIFEVPASATSPVDPVPLVAMGRFDHEAVAVDPATGIVYETEDIRFDPDDPTRPGAGFYRFIPNRPGDLAAGGRLQVMAIQGAPGFVTVWGMRPGQTLPAAWIDIEDPNPASAEDDPSAVFREGLSKGAAAFARLEGAWAGDGGIYLVSTDGGRARAGQVFFYRPDGDGGELTLVFESPSRDVLDAPDNICVTPRGGLIICEDGAGDEFIRGLDRDGGIVDLVRQEHRAGAPEPGEFCGVVTSPDGEILFFNVQGDRTHAGTVASATYALWGPWEKGGL